MAGGNRTGRPRSSSPEGRGLMPESAVPSRSATNRVTGVELRSRGYTCVGENMSHTELMDSLPRGDGAKPIIFYELYKGYSLYVPREDVPRVE